MTSIEWTDATYNPVTGCTKVSPGCANCYIERWFKRQGGAGFVRGKIPVQLHPDRLDQPLRWRRPRIVFTCSMADLFHEDVPVRAIAQVFGVMAGTARHTFQVLTKRAARMNALLTDATFRDEAEFSFEQWRESEWRRMDVADLEHPGWPLPNVWLGVSVENQRWADERIPLLLDTPAAVRILSCEPLLGPLELQRWLTIGACGSRRGLCDDNGCRTPALDWVIVGGESGGPEDRRLVERCDHFDKDWFHMGATCGRCENGWRPQATAVEWVESIHDQCVAAGVPFFFKQWGGPTPKSGGRLLDGRTWDEMPARRSSNFTAL